MRTIAAAVIITALATPALAQFGGGMINEGLGQRGFKTEEEVKAQQQREQNYKSGLSKIPDQKSSTDPWGNVRTETKPAPGKPAAVQKKPDTATR